MNKQLQKHEYNFFPTNDTDYKNIVDNISKNGYDKTLPITMYQDKILDGWHRYQACIELNVIPCFTEFKGSDVDAFNFSVRTNKDRRHLNSQQLSCVAIEAVPIYNAIVESVEKEKLRKQSENAQNKERNEKGNFTTSEKKFSDVDSKKDSQETRTATKVAEVFGTNQSYVNKAKKLKEESPEKFEEVKQGKTTFQEIEKEKKEKDLEKKKEEVLKQTQSEIKIKPIIKIMNAVDFLNTFEDDSVDCLFTDPPYSTDIDDIESFVNGWLPLAIRKLKPNSRSYICIGAYPIEIKTYLDVLLRQNKFIVDNPLVWTYRNTLGITPKMKYNLNYQIILHLYSKTSKELDTSITNEMFSVQDINAPDGRQGDRFHTWQKPFELSDRLIRHSTNENDLVVDCFSCTGTFLLSASKLKRKAIGCEINLENAKIAEKRGCQIEKNF